MGAKGLNLKNNQSGGGGGTSDYTDLSNKPQINGVTLKGNKTSADLENRAADAQGRMGYKILKPTETFASQVTAENTIYEIRDVFDLGNTTVTIPSGSTLKFNGGIIKNGTITGNNTAIDAPLTQLFDTSVTLSGTWNVDEGYPEWFGAVGDGVADDRVALQKSLDSFRVTTITKKYLLTTYSDGACINIPSNHTLKSNYVISTDNAAVSDCLLIWDGTADAQMSVVNMDSGSSMENIQIRSMSRTNVIGCTAKGSRINLLRVSFVGCDIGLYTECFLSTFTSVSSYNCNKGFFINGNMSGGSYTSQNTSLTLLNCYAHSCAEYGYYFKMILYSTLVSCACDNCGVGVNSTQPSDTNLIGAYLFEDCTGITATLGAEGNIRNLYAKNCSILDVNMRYSSNASQAVSNAELAYMFYVSYVYNSSFLLYGQVANQPSSVKKIFYYYFGNTRNMITTNLPQSSIGYHTSGELQQGINNTRYSLRSCTDTYAWLQPLNGSATYRPALGTTDHVGLAFYDTTLGKTIYWDGALWKDEHGCDLTGVTSVRGDTTTRTAMSLSADNEGLQYYDTTLHKYVMWNGTAWVNMDGTALS